MGRSALGRPREARPDFRRGRRCRHAPPVRWDRTGPSHNGSSENRPNRSYHLIIQRPTREAGSAENRKVAAEAADAAVTIVYDRKHVIPLTRPGAALAVVKLTKENINEIVAIGRRIGPNYANAYPDLVTALKGVGFTVQEYAHDAPIPSGSNVVAAGRTILFR
jgi:hypothetical protein